MPVALKRLAGTPSGRHRCATIAAGRDIDPARLGLAYLEQAGLTCRDNAALHRQAALNFLYIGHIARALPKARIVCLRRNPMDGYGATTEPVRSQSAYYAYSYDLLDGALYARFDRQCADGARCSPTGSCS